MSEQTGVLQRWDDSKGFGFIAPDDGSPALFVHISAMRGAQRPALGDAVCFTVGSDAQGRLRALHMRHAGLAIDRPAIRRPPRPASARRVPASSTGGGRAASVGIRRWPLKLVLWLALVLLPVAGALQLAGQGQPWALLGYPLLSLLSFCQYGLDKQHARKGRWRTPESSLHLVELAGGWPGALLAQQLLRHKTRKLSYQAVFWAIVALHQLFWLDALLLGGRYLRHGLPF